MSFELGVRRLRGNCLHLGIFQAANGDRVEDRVQPTDHMAFDDLCGDVGDERLLRNLDGGCDQRGYGWARPN